MTINPNPFANLNQPQRMRLTGRIIWPYFFVFIGLLGLPGGLLTQADSERTLSVSVGMSRTANRDGITSPLIYSGNLPTLQLAYSHRSPANRHLISLAVATGMLSSAASPLFRANNVRGVLTYGYARRIVVKNTKAEIGAGTDRALEQAITHLKAK